MITFEQDTEKILLLMQKYQVEFILVGGLAVNFYGYSRSTGDIDVWVKDKETNRINLISALIEYGIVGAEQLQEVPFIAGYTQILLDSGIYLDLMSSLRQFPPESFDTAYKNASDYQLLPNIKIKIISYNDLIYEKKNSLRTKDTSDARELEDLNQ